MAWAKGIEAVVKESSCEKTCLNKVDFIINQLITISFLNFSDEIKQDSEITEVFIIAAVYCHYLYCILKRFPHLFTSTFIQSDKLHIYS